MPNKPRDRPRSGLNSGLDVLECVAGHTRPLSLTEIAAALGMSKSSVHMLLATLEKRGFLNRLPDQSYCVGVKAWEVGRVATPTDLARVAAPHLAALMRELSEGVSIGVLDGLEMVCVQLVESPRAVRVHSSVGDRSPAHCVSSGLAALSTLDDDALATLLPQRLEPATEDSIADRATLLQELTRVRARGYAVSRGAWRLEVAGVSLPLRVAGDHPPAGLCVAAPRFRVTDQWIKQVMPAMRFTADAIHREFGAVKQPAPDQPRTA